MAITSLFGRQIDKIFEKLPKKSEKNNFFNNLTRAKILANKVFKSDDSYISLYLYS